MRAVRPIRGPPGASHLHGLYCSATHCPDLPKPLPLLLGLGRLGREAAHLDRELLRVVLTP